MSYLHLLTLLVFLSIASRTSAATIQYVVQISSDGLASAFLRTYISNTTQFPNFARLAREGASTMNARCDYDISETLPNHATMLTARPTSQRPGFANDIHHGWTNNFPQPTDIFHTGGNPSLEYVHSVFDVVHDRGLRTGFFASKTRLEICERSYNATNGAPDTIGVDNGRDKIDIHFINNGPMTTPVDRLLATLQTNPPIYSFIHLTEPDAAGHSFGWGSVNYSNAVRGVDVQLGRIMTFVTTNSRLAGRTAVILTSDHGGGGGTGTTHTQEEHPQNFTIPFFVWGPSIAQGVDAYSIFSNHYNPGTNRVDYTEENQPIRNGDTCNLALELLGLPPIPYSLMIPLLIAPPVDLVTTRTAQGLTISWPVTASADGFTLEVADPAAPTLVWTEITTGIVNTGSTFQYQTTLGTDQSRLYRLKR